AFLLEILSDFQVTIPELRVVKAERAPIVVITSNRTREIHDALKRRCLYHWVDYPDALREVAIVRAKAPQAPARLTAELVAFVQAIRAQDLFKSPGVAETLDRAAAQSSVSATPGDLNKSCARIAWTKATSSAVRRAGACGALARTIATSRAASG